MPDEYPLTLRQTDQARRHASREAEAELHPADFAAIADGLDFIKAQLARIPTRKELARLILLGTLTTAALVLCGIEALFR